MRNDRAIPQILIVLAIASLAGCSGSGPSPQPSPSAGVAATARRSPISPADRREPRRLAGRRPSRRRRCRGHPRQHRRGADRAPRRRPRQDVGQPGDGNVGRLPDDRSPSSPSNPASVAGRPRSTGSGTCRRSVSSRYRPGSRPTWRNRRTSPRPSWSRTRRAVRPGPLGSPSSAATPWVDPHRASSS